MVSKRKCTALILAVSALLTSALSPAQTRGTLKDGSEYDRTMQQAGMTGMTGMSGDGSVVAKKPVKKKPRKKSDKTAAAPK